MMTKTYKIPYAIQTQNKQSAISYSPGTCGELMQGYLNGQDFLINSPIPFFSRVSILLRASGPVKVLSAGCFHKVRSVVKATLIALGYGHLGAEVEIESKIPRGKGLASSTSELTSAIMATAKALDEAISD
ncbi:MAG: hypothetical protein KA436_06300, partial [Oligoflexales bacterium]|nr:hypothetical protein [Oligoflexales bacterium]